MMRIILTISKLFDINNIRDLQTFFETNKEMYILCLLRNLVNNETNAKNCNFHCLSFGYNIILAAMTNCKEQIF